MMISQRASVGTGNMADARMAGIKMCRLRMGMVRSDMRDRWNRVMGP
jgi:hypothetical protein